MPTDTLITWDAPSGSDGLRDLMNYIQEHDPAYNGRIRLQETTASTEAMGPTTDQLILEGVIGLSGQLIGFAVAWLRSKRSRLSLTVQHGNRKFVIKADTRDAEIKAFVMDALRETQGNVPGLAAPEGGDAGHD